MSVGCTSKITMETSGRAWIFQKDSVRALGVRGWGLGVVLTVACVGLEYAEVGGSGHISNFLGEGC